MIANVIFENGEFTLPNLTLSNEARFSISVLSIRCSFETPMNATKFLCLRTNLVAENPFNPHQIIAVFTVSRHVKNFTFNLPHRQPYNLAQHDLPRGGFMICEIGRWNEEIAVEKGVLQLFLKTRD